VVSSQYTLHDLPVNSQVLLDVLELCQHPQSTHRQLANSILLDPVLCALLLSMTADQLDPSNSEMPLMEQVIGRLGRSAVQAVALDIARRLCQQPPCSTSQALHTRLRGRMILTAKLASAFAILSGYGNPSEAYLVGLLQGIGHLRIVVAAGGESGPLGQNSDETAIASEGRQMFPQGHSIWAYQLAKQWGMPGFFADALRYQDYSREQVADAHPLIRLSSLAAKLASHDLRQVDQGLKMAQLLFGVEHDLGQEILSQATAEAQRVADELLIQVQSDFSQPPPQALGELVEDLLEIQTLFATVSVDESAGLEPRRVFARVLAQAIGCKQFRLLIHAPISHQLLGFSDGRDALVAAQNDADWQISLSPARSIMALAFDQGRARLLSSSSERRSVADEQMLGMLEQPAALCLPVIVDAQCGLLVVAGGNEEAMLALSTRQRYLQLVCAMLARLLSRQRARVAGDPELHGADSMDVRELVHELSNPLNVASNYLNILQHKVLKEGIHYDELAIATEELQRAAELLRSWRLPVESSPMAQAVDVNAVISRVVNVYRPTLLEPRGIELVLELDEQGAMAQADEAALQQVLRNLLSNAIEAVDDGGHILIKTSAEVYMDSGNYVELLVADDGPGLPAGVRKNIFKPVQSSKGADHSGLGLSIVKSLVNQANGSIAFSSSAHGTRFQVYLPA
jgi:signal transduction histidine kinase/HD-like signal output (HDOD) protein